MSKDIIQSSLLSNPKFNWDQTIKGWTFDHIKKETIYQGRWNELTRRCLGLFFLDSIAWGEKKCSIFWHEERNFKHNLEDYYANFQKQSDEGIYTF